MLFGALFFGVAFGALSSSGLLQTFSLPDSTAQLGAVGVSNVSDKQEHPDQSMDPSTRADDTLATAVPSIITAPLQNSISEDEPEPSYEAERQVLVVQISDAKQKIAELHTAIEQVKNDSLGIVVVFNQNCGSWEAECAQVYSRSLKENNEAYTTLTGELALQTRELKALEERWSELLP